MLPEAHAKCVWALVPLTGSTQASEHNLSPFLWPSCPHRSLPSLLPQAWGQAAQAPCPCIPFMSVLFAEPFLHLTKIPSSQLQQLQFLSCSELYRFGANILWILNEWPYLILTAILQWSRCYYYLQQETKTAMRKKGNLRNSSRFKGSKEET